MRLGKSRPSSLGSLTRVLDSSLLSLPVVPRTYAYEPARHHECLWLRRGHWLPLRRHRDQPAILVCPPRRAEARGNHRCPDYGRMGTRVRKWPEALDPPRLTFLVLGEVRSNLQAKAVYGPGKSRVSNIPMKKAALALARRPQGLRGRELDELTTEPRSGLKGYWCHAQDSRGCARLATSVTTRQSYARMESSHRGLPPGVSGMIDGLHYSSGPLSLFLRRSLHRQGR